MQSSEVEALATLIAMGFPTGAGGSKLIWEDCFPAAEAILKAGWSNAESVVGNQVVGHGPGPYKTLGHIAAEVRRMQADDITRESIEYVLDQVFGA